MEQRFSNNSLDLETLREFCKREGEAVFYRKGDQLEREGDPARWLAFVIQVREARQVQDNTAGEDDTIKHLRPLHSPTVSL